MGEAYENDVEGEIPCELDVRSCGLVVVAVAGLGVNGSSSRSSSSKPEYASVGSGVAGGDGGMVSAI